MTRRSDPRPDCPRCRGLGFVMVSRDPDVEADCVCTDPPLRVELRSGRTVSEKPEETIVVSFLNSDGNLQLVTEGPDAACPTCGYPERHRAIEITDELALIADGCPSCETSRMPDREIRTDDDEFAPGECDGSATCSAPIHVHGCFKPHRSDECDSPDEYGHTDREIRHEFLPVAGHPDDDECTYREDGTDATYCGEPRDAHAPDPENRRHHKVGSPDV